MDDPAFPFLPDLPERGLDPPPTVPLLDSLFLGRRYTMMAIGLTIAYKVT